jgi:hypothetical protein
MKRTVLLMFFAALVVAGCDLFYDEFTLALNLEPVKHTYALNPGGTSYTLPPTFFDLGSYVDSDYAGDITGGGIYNIGVMLAPAHTGRTINGKAAIAYGSYSATISYTGNWNDFSTERTILSDPTLVSIDDPAEFEAMMREIFRQNPLPTITLQGDGTSSQAISAGDNLTISLYGQAAASITLK